MKTSRRINSICEQIEDNEGLGFLSELADESCSVIDKLTPLEEFRKGFALAQKAGGKPVYEWLDSEERTSFYFIGSEDEVVRLLSSRSEPISVF